MSKTLPLNQRGHLFTDKTTVDVLRFDDHEFVDLSAAASCGMCGVFAEYEVTDTAVTMKEWCPHPDGITTVIDLAVPSGRIVVDDDLRHVYDGFDHDTFASYNTALGQAQVVRAMADLGCAFGPVGNSCPGLYRTGENTYVIASPGYDDEGEPTGFAAHLKPLAHITTDLWAYSIADHDDYTAKGGTSHPQRSHGPDVVDIGPGTYRFTHHTGEKGFDHYAHGTVIFAHIERIKES